MPISIYPPTLQSTQPAFLASETNYAINFTLQKITSAESIKHIQIRVINQRSNSSVVNTSKYPDNVIYKNVDLTAESSPYAIRISTSEDLREPWQAGCCYKIQLRFGKVTFPDSLDNFAVWKKEQIDQQNFSEWSTVMIIKAISQPNIYIENAGVTSTDIISTTKIESTLTPLFVGQYTSDDEPLEKYKFNLYDDKDNLIESSNWIQFIEGKSNSYRFKRVLENEEFYKVTFSISTRNEYTSTVLYNFQTIRNYLDTLEGVSFSADGASQFCQENGCVQLRLSANENLSGTYVITRTDETSNYKIYEDIKYLNYFNKKFNNELIYTDFTIESGIKYKYSFQYENFQGFRSAPLEIKNPVSVNFEYSYLYRDGLQLKLKLDQKVNTFKHTTLVAKQDTLGGQFPHLTKNGQAYYAEFPISGKISFQMDEDQTFFTFTEDGVRFKDELIIPKDRFTTSDAKRGKTASSFLINSNITEDNVFIERKFREKVEEFLNDFNYKLYRSPTEGNIIIGLMNVSMTPIASLGRMIFDFSATAYEVMENTISNLAEAGINTVSIDESEQDVVEIESFGQISGVYGSSIDLFKLIKDQEEALYKTDSYTFSLTDITYLQIESYPNISLNNQIYEAESLNDDSKVQELTELNNVLTTLSGSTITFNINGVKVFIPVEKKYVISEDINTLTLVQADFPIVINYKCVLTKDKQVVQGIKSIDGTRIWGQLAQTFDESSLLDTIEEAVRHQVEEMYGVLDGFKKNDKGQWVGNGVQYTFSKILTINIETDPNTLLYIGESEQNKKSVLVGSTGVYNISPADDLINYIAFGKSQYAIVNYKCLTNQIVIEEG